MLRRLPAISLSLELAGKNGGIRNTAGLDSSSGHRQMAGGDSAASRIVSLRKSEMLLTTSASFLSFGCL